MNQADMENSLRSLLAERAQQAPTGDLLADQIIARAGSDTVRSLRTHRRRAWTLPLLTAAAVAAVVAGTVAVSSLHPSTSKGRPAALPSQSTISQAPVSSPTSTPPVTTFNNPSDLATTANSSATAIGLENFSVGDLTFVGNDIWALGTATCLTSGQGVCTAFVHSSDGTHWTTVASTPFNVPGDTGTNDCAVRCVSHIRFASEKVGYVYGPSSLLMTLDGGQSWQPQSGGAVALETLSGNVIRVEESTGCPPGCTFTVQTAKVGSTHWTTVPISVPGQDGDGAQLSRYGNNAYLLFTGNPAGGAGSAQSALFQSSDNGATWTPRGEPCVQGGSEVDSVGLVAVDDASMVVACQPRQQSAGTRPSVGYGHFAEDTSASSTGLPSAPIDLLGAGSEQNICVDSSALYCSQDSGTTFSKATGADGGPGRVSFIGFEDATDGHALEVDSSGANGAVSKLWSTTDGGRSWSASTIAD
jgi:photosystem II stability/assembly factor-like uncharacterized protein